MITPSINKKIGEAMKAHDEILLSTLRLLSSAFNYEKIAKQHELSEEEELAVVRREAKKRKDAIEAYQQAQGKSILSSPEELVKKIEKERKELEILEEFLPEQLADEVLEKMVKEAIAKTNAASLSDMGKVIGMVMKEAKGLAEGGKVAQLVKECLTSKP